MKLAEALEAIARVPISEINEELASAEKELAPVKEEARKVFNATIKKAMDKVKMLRRLKMSKEKAGKPLGKKKRGA